MKEDFMICFRAADIVYVAYRKDGDNAVKNAKEVQLRDWNGDLQEAFNLFDRSNNCETLESAWIPAAEMPAWAERN